MHGKVELGVIVIYGTHKCIHAYLCRKFLAYLTFQGCLGCFAWFHFTTGELPPVLPFAITALGGEHLIVFANNRCYYFNLLHNRLQK